MKARVFYSLLKSASATSRPVVKKQGSASTLSSNQNLNELSCMDESVESTIFKICLISNMFIEYHALPARPGKSEIKQLQMAFAMRTSVFFEVYQTFI